MGEHHASLLELAGIEIAILPVNRANGTVNGTTHDLTAFEHVDFLVYLGVTDGTLDVKLQSGNASNASDMADVAGATLTQLGATDDNHIAVLSVPSTVIGTKRYVRVVAVAAAATVGVLYGIIAFKYPRSGQEPPTQIADVIQLKKLSA